MPVEFPGIAATDDGSRTTPRSGAAFDEEDTPEEVAERHAERTAHGTRAPAAVGA
ncbi:hypothetical protein ACFY3N_14265 [Streptomyces sp. NPDC000348]|uniref:hypothetical protein n=1 Tax=Streptomyces sp. NPDC000348 TaxID=3364538 RepID=UPI0036C6B8F3